MLCNAFVDGGRDSPIKALIGALEATPYFFDNDNNVSFSCNASNATLALKAESNLLGLPIFFLILTAKVILFFHICKSVLILGTTIIEHYCPIKIELQI